MTESGSPSANPHAEDALGHGAQAQHHFEAQAPTKHIERMQHAKQQKGEMGIALSELWLGVAVERKHDGTVNVGFACHDGTYTIDFAVHTLGGEGDNGTACPTALPKDDQGMDAAISDYLVCAIRNYKQRNSYKFLGAGLSHEVYKLSPSAGPRFWTELDIVPIVVGEEGGGSLETLRRYDAEASVDELADGLARKALMYAVYLHLLQRDPTNTSQVLWTEQPAARASWLQEPGGSGPCRPRQARRPRAVQAVGQ